MEKKIEDYLHLYIGQKVKVPGAIIELTHAFISTFDFKHYGIKLLLRPLSDMTNKEKDAWFTEVGLSKRTMIEEIEACALGTKYLLSRGFDLFGLIESGKALDKTKIKQP